MIIFFMRFGAYKKLIINFIWIDIYKILKWVPGPFFSKNAPDLSIISSFLINRADN